MGSAVSRLGLGVARFGGSASGPSMSTAEAFATVALAADAGLRLIDCPPEPEDAERVLGQVLPHVPTFQVTAHTARVEGGASAVLRRLRTSLRRMGLERVDTVLAHPTAITAPDGAKLWDGLLRLKDEGVVGAVGISACICDDPSGLARRFRPDIMQLPLSLLDQRLLVSGVLDDIAGRGVALHLRSIFLHGLLFFDSAGALSPQVSRVRRVLAEAGADPMQAALAFALAQPHASRVVVGVGSPSELRAVVKAVTAAGPKPDWQALRTETSCAMDPARCRAA